MVLTVVKKIAMFIPDKLISINKNVNTIINLPENANKTFTYVTKVTGAAVGAAGAAKETVDLAKALACQDGICAFVSAVGVAADGLQICTSFIPGPNVTSIVTTPVYVGCKVLVWCCKKSKLPWGSC